MFFLIRISNLLRIMCSGYAKWLDTLVAPERTDISHMPCYAMCASKPVAKQKACERTEHNSAVPEHIRQNASEQRANASWERILHNISEYTKFGIYFRV